MTIPHIPTILAAALAAAALAAQTPQTPEAALATAPHTLPWPDHALTDVAADGTLWAGHESWKASFAADGATFHPFLGAEAPATHATFALRAVRCAGHEVPLGATTPVLHGQRVDFDRGGAIESYELRREGIEQRFVFDALPARGALQLDVGVTSDLTVAADANGHTLLGDRGGLRYGNATAVDARGRSCDVPVQFADGAFHLTVPGDFVAAAALPLVVDPFVGTVNTLWSSGTKELLAADIAQDQSLGQFYVTYERAFSATDHDVYVVYTDQNLVAQGLVTVDFTTAYWSRPRVAVLEASDTACVVAQTSTGNVAPFAVQARILLGGATPLLQPALQLGTGSDNYLDPDIGGDADPIGPSNFLVAFEEVDQAQTNSILVNLLIDAFGTQVSNQTTVTSNTGHLQRVAVSKTCGSVGNPGEGWGMLYRYVGFGQSIGQLRTSYMGRTGIWHAGAGGYFFGTVGNITPNAGSEWDISSPTDAANGRNLLCVESRVDQATGKGSIYGALVNSYCTTLLAPTLLVGGPGNDYRQPVVDSDGTHFVTAFAKVYNTNDHDVRALALSSDGNQLFVLSNEFVTLATDKDTQPAICAFGGEHSKYAVAWSHSDGTNWSIQAQRFAAVGQGLFATRNTDCGGGGLGITGSWTLGQSFTVTANAPNAIPALLAGAPVSVPLGPCPGCTLGVDGTLFVGGQLTVAVPFVPSLIGVVFSVQGVRIDWSANSCLGLFQLGTTYDLTLL